jgi:Protein of unknown function (DUF1579)
MTSETTQWPPIEAEPQKEHRWLQKLVGEWTYERETSMGAERPPEKSTGTESVRSLGDLWIVGEAKTQMPSGEPESAMLTLGYDPQKKRFVGTWVGSIMTYLWVYEGRLDDAERVLTLDCEGPGMSEDGTMAKYQDIIELVSDDHRIFRSRTLGVDGQWNEFIVYHYQRVK